VARAPQPSGDSPALALGLIKRGHVYRMQGRWDEAIPFYDSAAQIAARMRDAVRQADAIAWRALTHNSRGARGSALTDATEAARLAETRAQERIYGDATLFVKTESRRGLSREIRWTDVYVKRGSGEPQNVSQCGDGANCTKPALSPDRKTVAFVKGAR